MESCETLSAQTHKFRVPDGIYLLSHSVGCLPADMDAAIDQAVLGPWANAGGDAWPEWLRTIDRFRAEVALLLNTVPEGVCPQANVSSALTKIISAVRPKVIAVSAESFPSIGYVAQKSGAEVRYVTDWREALTSDVDLAVMTHVTSNLSHRMLVEEMTARAKEQGITTVVDIAQSAGVIPIDSSVWSADFLIGSCIKWLCGGSGAGFLWTNPDRVSEYQPQDVGWFSHGEPFEMDLHAFRYAKDALRFWGGTPSILPFAIAAHSLSLLNGVGIAKIHAHNQRLCDRLISAAEERGIGVMSPLDPSIRGGTVTLDLESVNGPVRADHRAGAGVRLSPHLYNTDSEMEEAVDQLSSQTS